MTAPTGTSPHSAARLASESARRIQRVSASVNSEVNSDESATDTAEG